MILTQPQREEVARHIERFGQTIKVSQADFNAIVRFITWRKHRGETIEALVLTFAEIRNLKGRVVLGPEDSFDGDTYKIQ